MKKTKEVFSVFSALVFASAPVHLTADAAEEVPVNWPTAIFEDYDNGAIINGVTASDLMDSYYLYYMSWYYTCLRADPVNGYDDYIASFGDDTTGEDTAVQFAGIAEYYNGSAVLPYQALLDAGAYMISKGGHIPAQGAFNPPVIPDLGTGTKYDASSVAFFYKVAQEISRGIPEDFIKDPTRLDAYSYKIFSRIINGEVDADVNLDGKLTYADFYELDTYRKYVSEGKTVADYDRADIWEACSKCDIFEDGRVNVFDSGYLAGYFEFYLLTPAPSPEIMEKEFYEARFGTVTAMNTVAEVFYSQYFEHSLRGDTDGDGIITSADASAVIAYYAVQSTGETDDNLTRITMDNLGDINGDGITDSADASEILSRYAENSVR